MLKISDFARIGQVSMSALRYYDEIGLLRPISIDPSTGYRFYEPEQLLRLHRIQALKDTGLGLAQIMQVLDEKLSPEELSRILRLKQEELQLHIQKEQEQLTYIEARLQSLEQGDDMPAYEVVLKKTEPFTVIATRDIVGNVTQKVQHANDMLAFLKRNSIRPMGNLLHLYYNHEYRDMPIDVEIAVPVARSLVDSLVKREERKWIIRELPMVTTMASILYHGSPYKIDEVFSSLGRWLESHAYTVTGTRRTICLRREADLNDCLIEIQFPVEKTG